MAGYAAAIPYGFQVGYAIGSDMRERSAQSKVAGGLAAYQQAIEGGGGALPEDNVKRADALRAAEDEFFSGLQDAGLSLEETRQAMTDFSLLKKDYVMRTAASGLAMYGSPEAAPYLESALDAVLPGRGAKFVGYDDEDPSISVYEVTDEEGATSHIPLSKAQMEQFLVGLESGPTAALAWDPRMRAVNERFKAEEAEAGLAKTVAETEKARAGAAYSYAGAERQLAEAGQTATESKAAKSARTYVSGDDLINKLDLEYSDTLLPVYEGDRAGFDQAYIAVADSLSTQLGREATPNEVLNAIEQIRSAPE